MTGRVVLQGGMVGSIRITVEAADGSFRRIIVADGSGNFYISGVPTGQVFFNLEAEGYRPQRESVDVLAGAFGNSVQFLMRPMPIATGSKEPSVASSTLRIPQDALKEFEAGMRAVERKEWKKARQHFENALKRHAEFPHALRAVALIDLAEQQPDRGLDRLRRAVQIDASFAEGYLTLSHLLNTLGRHSEAMQASQKLVSLRSDLWQGHYEMGVAALSLGQVDLAQECSQRVEQVGGAKVPELRLLRAGVFLKKLKNDEAKAQLLDFLSLAPDHALAPLAKQILSDIEKKISPPIEKEGVRGTWRREIQRRDTANSMLHLGNGAQRFPQDYSAVQWYQFRIGSGSSALGCDDSPSVGAPGVNSHLECNVRRIG